MWCLYSYANQQARIGVTNFAQKSIGDVRKLELPNIGQRFDKNETVAKLETDNNVFSLYSPIRGKVAQVNAKAFEDATYINQNAENFWIVEYSGVEEAEVKELMKETQYYAYTEQLEKAAGEKPAGEKDEKKAGVGRQLSLDHHAGRKVKAKKMPKVKRPHTSGATTQGWDNSMFVLVEEPTDF